MKTHHRLKKLTFAVSLGLLASANTAVAQEEGEIEEVVATGTRLQGSAAAVIAERKNQAFVADILGAEQLARTGDSDAASALRRVTGLTLVDDKFIYVRGLGERYSSARLNGANIPSPDLTRNVVPLDIFPASIIESMAVQKAFSPNMPAAFGGGSIDIRTKSVPSDFTAGIELGVGYDSSADDGYTYNRPGGNVPAPLLDAITTYRGDFSINNIISRGGLQNTDTATVAQQATAINNGLLTSLPRDLALKEESLDPAYNIKGFIGDSFQEDFFGGTIGVLASAAYDTKWDAAEKRTGVIAQDVDGGNCSTNLDTSEDVANSCFNTVKDSLVTTENERYNGVLNLGYRLDNHNISWMNMYLADNEDETDVSSLQSPAGSTVFSIVDEGRANRTHEFDYEERTLKVSQVVGQHTFLDYWGIGVDWQYTRSRAQTEIPLSASFRFRDNYDSGAYVNSNITGDDNRVIYSYTDMDDRVNSYGGNISLPIFVKDFEIELKAGYDFSDRARVYNTSSFAVNNATGSSIFVNEAGGDPLLNSGYLTDSFIDGRSILVDFNEPTAPDADDYIAAQKIDAGYAMFDVLYQGTWRVSGGLRYEEFKQSSIGTSSLIFTKEDQDIFYDPDKIEAGSIATDDVYPSLALTYVENDYQIRASYGETIVRPDLREVVPVSYFDPLTDIRTFGRIGLQSSPIKNYDLRYESYSDNGDNFSIAAFYKDITSPIETVLQIGDEDYSATFVNGETGEVYGVETEWLYDLSWVSNGFFTSGNVTISDSEVTIDPALAGNLTNPTKRMNGHSEYVVNLQLNYDSADGLHSASLVYNVFGERIIASGVGGREDALEQPFHSVDLVYTYYPDFNSKVKVKIKNLLDEEQEVTQSGVAVRTTEKGTGISVSYSYEF